MVAEINVLSLHLMEIVNPPVVYVSGEQREPAFASACFRPVNKTHLDVFRNLLVAFRTRRRYRLQIWLRFSTLSM